MRSIEPFLKQALEKVEQLKASESQRSRSLETIITDYKQQQARERQAAEASEAAHRGDGSLRQGQPVQFSSEPYLRAPDSQGRCRMLLSGRPGRHRSGLWQPVSQSHACPSRGVSPEDNRRHIRDSG